MKLRRSKKTNPPNHAVVGSGGKGLFNTLYQRKKKLIAIVIFAALVALALTGSWLLKRSQDVGQNTQSSEKAPEINLAEETAALSIEGLTTEEKYQHYFGLARSYEARNDYAKAAESLEKASEFTNDDSRLYLDAANDYFHATNYRKAAELAQKALALIDKGNAENFEQIGDLYMYEGNKNDARSFYEKAKKSYENKPELDGDITKADIIKRIETKLQKLSS